MRPSNRNSLDPEYLTQMILVNIDPAVLAHGRGILNNEFGITSWAFDDLVMDLCWAAAMNVKESTLIINGDECADIVCEDIANDLGKWMTCDNLRSAWEVLGGADDSKYIKYVTDIIKVPQ